MKQKAICDKCKSTTEALWKVDRERTDGTVKEQWVCTDCAKSLIKGFGKIDEATTEFERKTEAL